MLIHSVSELITKTHPVIDQSEHLARELDEDVSEFHSKADVLADHLRELLNLKQQLVTHVQEHQERFQTASDDLFTQVEQAKEGIGAIETRVVQVYADTERGVKALEREVSDSDAALRQEIAALSQKLVEQHDHIGRLKERLTTGFAQRSERLISSTTSVLSTATEHIQSLGQRLETTMREEVMPSLQSAVTGYQEQLHQVVQELETQAEDTVSQIGTASGDVMSKVAADIDHIQEDLQQIGTEFCEDIKNIESIIKDVEQIVDDAGEILSEGVQLTNVGANAVVGTFKELEELFNEVL